MVNVRALKVRPLLLAACSVAALGTAAPATAQIANPILNLARAADERAALIEYARRVEIGYDLQIVTNHTVTPGPGNPATGANYANSANVLSTGVNGVGQQISFNQAGAGASLGLCTGTLINPRTVITAAHCVYNRPAHQYGSITGTGGGVNGPFGAGGAVVTSVGTPLSFGFNSTNRCQGIAVNGCAVGTGAYEAWRNSSFHTNVGLNIYNANQVWYGTGSQPIALGGGGEFANQDIALVTLDTHAAGIPTWALLFSPLDGPTHTTITGYGGAGVGLSGIGSLAGIDYRRRSAENMIDALMTNNDWVDSPAINAGNTAFAAHQHSVYWTDFDDPNHDPNNLPANFFNNTAPAGSRNNGYYDFNGLGGAALPREGSTAGGDSGGPLIVDERWGIDVIAGVLTGSWSFNGGISTYGQFNVYPPLFQFWEQIVQNNPYVYASAKAGNGDWFDPTHWVQDMDPNYMVIGPDGQLVNALPSAPQGGADGVVDKFGTLCFLEADCTTFNGPSNTPWAGTSLIIPGGPGSTNFVPNNVEPVNSATAALNVKARYYDVTLRQAGTTTLSQAATIDVMTVSGARLDIRPTGTLNTWADFTQNAGWTNVDGVLNTNEMLVVSGLLSGNGTINADFVTVVGGAVAPGGGDRIGTLTVNSDLLLSSASSYFVDASRAGGDLLDIAGVLALTNGAIVFNKVTDAPAPRYGQIITIAHADLGVNGMFGTAYTFQGVLRPFLTYTATDVRAELRAGSLVEILDGGSAIEIAFASALDQLRSSSYSNLWNLYGAVDWMNASQLSSSLSSLAPRVVGESKLMQERQSRTLLGAVGNRISLLGTGRAQGMAFDTDGLSMLSPSGGASRTTSSRLGFSRGAVNSIAPLSNGISGFVSGGVDQTRSSYGETGNASGRQRSWHIGMGLELPVGSNAAIGTAAGYAEGESRPNGDRSEARTTLAAAYGSMSLGGGAYIGGIIAAETATADVDRLSHDGVSVLRLNGATSSKRYTATAEAGVRKSIGSGMALTPRVQLGFSRYALNGFNEHGGDTALRFANVGVNRLETRVGATLDGATEFHGWKIRPQLQADYVQALNNGGSAARVRFAAAPEQAFLLPLGDGGRSWGEVKGGVQFDRGIFSLGLNAQAAVGGAPLADQRGAIDLTIRF